MRAFIRVCAVAGLFLVAALAGPAAQAGAAVPPPPEAGCGSADDGYGAGLPCDVEVAVLTPVCDGDVPRLRYAVAPAASSGTVDVRFVHPGGDDVVHADQPLSGTVPWPGAVVDAAGAGVDWPGWRLEDGVWVAGDEYDWVRRSVEVAFDVDVDGAVASAVVAYPPSTPDCLTDPERSDVLVAGGGAAAGPPAAASVERAEVLSATGASAGPIALIAAGLLLAGAAGVLARRRA